MTSLLALIRHLTHTGQCNICGGRFENWPGGICDACLATGRR